MVEAYEAQQADRARRDAEQPPDLAPYRPSIHRDFSIFGSDSNMRAPGGQA